METHAAVAHQAGQPLTIETLNLAGPKEGESTGDGAGLVRHGVQRRQGPDLMHAGDSIRSVITY